MRTSSLQLLANDHRRRRRLAAFSRPFLAHPTIFMCTSRTRDRRRGNEIDRTNGTPCSMVNWIRKLPRRAGRCSLLPDQVIRCGGKRRARITHGTLMTADFYYSSSCCRNWYVTDAINQLPPPITIGSQILITTVMRTKFNNCYRKNAQLRCQ